MHKNTFYSLGAPLLLWVIIPASALSVAAGNWGAHFLLHSFMAIMAYMLLRSIALPFLKPITISAVTLYYSVLYLLATYAVVTGGLVDLRFMLDSFSDIGSVAIALFSPLQLLMGLIGFIVLLLVQATTTIKTVKLYWPQQWVQPLLFMTIGFVANLQLLPHQQFLIPLHDTALHAAPNTSVELGTMHAAPTMKLLPPIAETIDGISTDENIMILQLESTNALALQGKAIIKEQAYNNNYMPVWTNLAKHGVLFPFFWGNSIQTNRGQANILCSTVNNIAKAFSYTTDLLPSNCLPKLMSDAGFATHFFRADKLEFANTKNFMKEIGFQHIHYKDIMEEGDLRYRWGYDDCTFYGRIFDYLDNKPHDPLFAYIEVSANHMNFGIKEEYKNLAPFPDEQNYLEKYLNSAVVQDHCLGEFSKRFKQYADNTHLIIVGDHSWPIGIHDNTYNERGATTDNFLVPLLYIPPTHKTGSLRARVIEHIRPSQVDIRGTVLDLVSDNEYQNSFAPLLTGEPLDHFEDCQVMTQPYGGTEVAIVHGNLKYTHAFTTGITTTTNLATDLLELAPITTKQQTYDEFLDEYMCQRYR